MGDEPLFHFGHFLTKLTWAEMNRIATHIADQAHHCDKNGEDFDPQYVGQMLSDMGREIVAEAEAEAAAHATGQ